MSDYEGVVDPRAQNYGKRGNDKNTRDETYIPMLEKLQELIILRDEKRSKLKTQKKPRKSSKMAVSSEDEESLESDDE